MISFKSSLAVLVLLSSTVAGWAGELKPAPGTLTQYVPGDVWFAAGSIATPEHAFVSAHWARVQKALAACGIDREIRFAILTSLPEDQRAAFEKTWDLLEQGVRQVNWSDLTAQELLFAQRFNGIFPDYFLILRPAAETRDQNVAGLAAVLRTLASFSSDGQFTYSEKQIDGVHVWAIDVRDVPVGIYLLHKDEIIAIVAGMPGCDDTRALLSGQCKVASLADCPRFRSALNEVPPPEHAYTFLDLDNLFTKLPLFPKLIMGQRALADGPHTPEEPAPQIATEGAVAQPTPSPVDAWLRLFATVMNHVDVLDYVVTSGVMEGTQEFAYTVTKAKESARSKPLYRMFAERKPVDSFERYLPVETTSFVVSSTLDVGILYDLIYGLIRDHVPGGADVCTQWAQFQREWNFDVQEDLFSWLGGEMVALDMPARTPSPFGSSEWVRLVRVRDSAKARVKVESGLQRAAAFMKSRGQPVQFVPATTLSAEKFQRIDWPIFTAMMMQPCVGVWEDWIVIAGSEHAARTVLDTAAGKHDNILKNERFRTEGLAATGPVCSATFADLNRTGEELTGFFMGLGFAAGSIPDTPESRPVRAMIRSLGSLASVFNEINFFSSAGSTTTFADGVWRTTTKITYRSTEP